MKILIIEDRKEYQGIAAEALRSHELVFVDNFRDAKRAMKDDSIDGIISDLFFPATAEEPIGENGQRLIDLIEGTRARPDWEEGYGTTEKTFVECHEPLAPMGLQMINGVMNHTNSFGLVIFSQGDRHVSALGLVRFSLDKLGLSLMDLFVQGGSYCDKKNPEHWQKAAQMLEPKCQMKLWQQLFSKSLPPSFNEVGKALTYFGK